MRRRDSMPTPSTDEIVDISRSSHATCPPEDDRSSTWRTPDLEQPHHDDSDETAAQNRLPTPSSPSSPLPIGSPEHIPNNERHISKMDVEDGSTSQELMSPVSVDDKQEETGQPALSSGYIGVSPSTSYDFSNVRLTPSSPSSYLRSGSKFQGSQQSERQVYDVQVEIKHVDMRESFLCGYLRIQGLTEDHPTLTTYFEGEIIGSKYTFLTQHEDWGSTDKVDLQHWAKFNAFRPFQKQAKKGNFTIPNLAQRENIFMRWKEHFLVPDHRVRTISGASFEGFYYICFNQCLGTVSGIYFHAKSEKFQQLELKHVPDRGCFGAMEFR